MIVYEFSRASVDHPERDEDAVLILPSNGKASVFAVIDGMGGHQHTAANGEQVTGREAARLVRETLIEDLATLPISIDASPRGEAEQRITAAITRAHERVLSELNGGDLPLQQRVGAVLTVTAICEDGKRLL